MIADDIEKYLKIIRIDDNTYCIFAGVPIVDKPVCIMMDKNQYNDLLAIIPDIHIRMFAKNERGLWETLVTGSWEKDFVTLYVSCSAYTIFRVSHPSVDHVQKLYDVLKKGLNAPKLLWKDRDIFDNYKRCIIKDDEIIEVWEY